MIPLHIRLGSLMKRTLMLTLEFYEESHMWTYCILLSSSIKQNKRVVLLHLSNHQAFTNVLTTRSRVANLLNEIIQQFIQPCEQAMKKVAKWKVMTTYLLGLKPKSILWAILPNPQALSYDDKAMDEVN